ncbi:hypothetical protein [Streptomyces corynorhini]|uniref:Uncharacterized protein n=1 Tax=Streptomyces corynorhini TaxID=2282652 RepID=A0A370B2V5_9ACTN|nr:hypothetical protein [Streptomyces corynorhini]RDG34193.1 hypothetical protein DVH02_30730 [Streptomyces corynorhini]
MTACAIETATADGEGADTGGAVRHDERVRRTEFTITADGSYAARLTLGVPQAPGDAGYGDVGHAEHTGYDDAWYPERWTLGGPEPYAVPLPLDQPEEPGTDLLPLADGRVLIGRRVADRHDFSLLYPTGPGTGQLPMGAVECAPRALTMLPPSPDGRCAYALVDGVRSTALWLVAGGAFGPELVAEVPGRCSGGGWLDRTGRMLALDRERDGVVKTVAVDLERGGEVTPLLQITDESNDRLLLADADSGLLLIRSDAPGHDRLGWGVLGSLRPVRFPECLRLPDCAVTPFAVQPGQVLMPESCAVALRIDGPGGSWLGTWRPADRRMTQRPAPQGWLAGAGLWTAQGVLRLPYATGAVPCGVARLVPGPDRGQGQGQGESQRQDRGQGRAPDQGPVDMITESAHPECADGEPAAAPRTPVMCRPVPLQQAPLTGRGQRPREGH